MGIIKSTLKITDDSGFMAIVNADRYISFVDTDWDFDQLQNHFVGEMNKNSLIIWATGLENIWTVDITDESANKPFFRAFEKNIEVTNGHLYLINYEDLSSVAQFDDEKIPLKHNENLSVKIDNGIYNVIVRQIADPELDIDSDPCSILKLSSKKLMATKFSNIQLIKYFGCNRFQDGECYLISPLEIVAPFTFKI